MLLRHSHVALCLLAVTCLVPRALSQQPESLPQIIEIELLLAEWATAPSEAGDELRNELSGSSDQVAERVAAMEKARKLSVVERFRLTTVEGSKALAQSNERVPLTRGVTIGQFGTTRQVMDKNVGTLIKITTSKGTPEAIQMELSFEKSRLFTPPDAPPLAETKQGEKIPAMAVATLTIQTAVRVASGKTAALAGHSSDGKHYVLLVSARSR